MPTKGSWFVCLLSSRLTACSEEDSDDDDDTDELLRELEKIKRERAEDKARQDQAQNAQDSVLRDAQIASANPLLNLAAQLGQGPTGVNTTAPGTFSVKRRWDDGVPTCFVESYISLTCIDRPDIQGSSHELSGW